MKNAEYYVEHPDEFDALSEEERMKLMVSGFSAEENDDEVEKKDEEEDEEETEDAAEESEEESGEDAGEEEPVVVAKDGKTTIPFSELQEARQRAKEASELAARLQAELEAMKKPEPPKQDEPPQKTVKDLRREAREALISGDMEKSADLDAQADELLIAQAEARAMKLVEPVKKSAEEQAEKAFYDAIRAVHPDFEQLIESGKIEAWIKSQPKIVQKAYMDVYESGTASEAIELLNMVKGTVKEPEPDKEAAKAKIAKAKAKPPASLSDVPASSTANVDEAEAMLEMDGLSLVNKFAGKSPDQINDMLARIM